MVKFCFKMNYSIAIFAFPRTSTPFIPCFAVNPYTTPSKIRCSGAGFGHSCSSAKFGAIIINTSSKSGVMIFFPTQTSCTMDDSQSLHRKWLEITKHPFFNGCLGFQDVPIIREILQIYHTFAAFFLIPLKIGPI